MVDHRWLLALLLFANGLFFVLTIRAGHPWGDDFAHYLIHARNLAEGKPYTDTGYVVIAEEVTLGPQNYPPAFPALLAPVYLTLGLNLTAFKLLEIASFIAYLFTLWYLLASYLPPNWRLAAIALMGFQPWCWDFKDSILSDYPGLLFASLALLMAQRLYARVRSQSVIAGAIALGVLVFLAAETRATALALLIAFPVYELLRWRRLTAVSMVCAVVAVAMLALQRVVIDTSYPMSFDIRPQWLIANSLNYVKTLRTIWVSDYKIVSYLVYALATGLGVYGVFKRGREAAGLFDLYAVFYMGVVAAYWVPGAYRYLLPVIPLYLAYMLAGLREITLTLPRPAAIAAITAGAAVAIAIFAGVYVHANWGAIREGLADPEYLQLSDFVKQHSGQSDITIFRKPRLLALTSERASAIYPNHATPKEMDAFVHRLHPRYIAVGNVSHSDFDIDRAVLEPYVEQFQSSLTRVWSSPHYALYQVIGW